MLLSLLSLIFINILIIEPLCSFINMCINNIISINTYFVLRSIPNWDGSYTNDGRYNVVVKLESMILCVCFCDPIYLQYVSILLQRGPKNAFLPTEPLS